MTLFQIHVILLQIKHQPMLFKAFGIFELDYTFIFPIVAATTGYYITMLQFEIDSLKEIQVS